MRNVTAFVGAKMFATGSLAEVALAVKRQGAAVGGVLVFDDETCRQIDLDLRGTPEEVAARYASADDGDEPGPRAGPGRPKLGVVSREISLLPRHWDWLATQSGGASVTLRKLVDGARKGSVDRDRTRQVQEATYRFMNAMAGDLPGFEEALRALYATDAPAFRARIAAWPADLRAHVVKLSESLLSAATPPTGDEPP